MIASSMSPPTRDVGPELAKLSGDARVLAEIRKLRLDMDACLNKIHQIHEAAKRGKLCIIYILTDGSPK